MRAPGDISSEDETFKGGRKGSVDLESIAKLAALGLVTPIAPVAEWIKQSEMGVIDKNVTVVDGPDGPQFQTSAGDVAKSADEKAGHAAQALKQIAADHPETDVAKVAQTAAAALAKTAGTAGKTDSNNKAITDDATANAKADQAAQALQKIAEDHAGTDVGNVAATAAAVLAKTATNTDSAKVADDKFDEVAMLEEMANVGGDGHEGIIRFWKFK